MKRFCYFVIVLTFSSPFLSNYIKLEGTATGYKFLSCKNPSGLPTSFAYQEMYTFENGGTRVYRFLHNKKLYKNLEDAKEICREAANKDKQKGKKSSQNTTESKKNENVTGNGNTKHCVAIEKKWGTRCGSSDSFSIILKNKCGKKTYYRICLKKKKGIWSCFSNSTFKSGSTAVGPYVCHGTGEIKWDSCTGGHKSCGFPKP